MLKSPSAIRLWFHSSSCSAQLASHSAIAFSSGIRSAGLLPQSTWSVTRMNVVGLGPRVAKLQAYGVRANCRSSVPSVMVGESSAIQTTSSQASPEGLTRRVS